MRHASNFLILSLLGAALRAAPAQASETPEWKTRSDLGSKKFERGWHNGFTGWMEIPHSVEQFHKERGLFEALTTGITRGVGLAIARTGTGIYEAVTCPYPVPENYEPLIMPERVEG